MTIKISPNDKGNPPGKLADAEIHFTDGPLDGLKLIGFGIWERRNGTGRNVTFPARQYSVNGERRSFALLRPTVDAYAQDRIRDLILAAYETHETARAEANDDADAVWNLQHQAETPHGKSNDPYRPDTTSESAF